MRCGRKSAHVRFGMRGSGLTPWRQCSRWRPANGSAAMLAKWGEAASGGGIMAKAVKPIPDDFHTITPFLTVKGAANALEFYKKAFGAEERSRSPGPDGRLMHAEMKIGDS